MDRTTELGLIDRALDLIGRRTTEMAPAMHRQPIAFYRDERQWQRERATLFRRLPLALGFGHDVRRPGDFFTHDLSGAPIVVLRGRDGVLRAFLNVCRHRGSKLEWAERGSGKTGFTCPYHAWSYAEDGRLTAVPHEHGFPDLDRAAHGLVALPVTERLGLVWAVPQGRAATGSQAWLGPFGTEAEALVPNSSVPHDVRRRELRANWKLTIDANLESYHFSYAHRATVGPMFHDALAIADRDGLNQRLFLPKRTIRGLAGIGRDTWRLREHSNLIYYFFPNTMVLIEPDHAQVLMSWPISPERTLVIGAQLLPEPPATDKARAYWDKNAAIFWGAIEEDFALMESVAATLGSGANEALTFARFEHAIAWFHEAVAESIGAER